MAARHGALFSSQEIIDQEHSFLKEEGYPYGGDRWVLREDGMIETWFDGDSEPISVETAEELAESVFCWANDC